MWTIWSLAIPALRKVILTAYNAVKITKPSRYKLDEETPWPGGEEGVAGADAGRGDRTLLCSTEYDESRGWRHHYASCVLSFSNGNKRQ